MISYNQFQLLTTIDNVIVAGSHSNKGLLYSKEYICPSNSIKNSIPVALEYPNGTIS